MVRPGKPDNTPDCIRIRAGNIYVYPGGGESCVCKTLINSYVRPLGKPFKSNCSWRKATGNHLHICHSHVYDDASAMTVSSRTCLRAENSSSSSSEQKQGARLALRRPGLKSHFRHPRNYSQFQC